MCIRDSANPGRVKFTASQRLNTQLVLDEFVLKKKKGPNMREVGLCQQDVFLLYQVFTHFFLLTWQLRLAAGACIFLITNVFSTGVNLVFSTGGVNHVPDTCLK